MCSVFGATTWCSYCPEVWYGIQARRARSSAHVCTRYYLCQPDVLAWSVTFDTQAQQLKAVYMLYRSYSGLYAPALGGDTCFTSENFHERVS